MKGVLPAKTDSADNLDWSRAYRGPAAARARAKKRPRRRIYWRGQVHQSTACFRHLQEHAVFPGLRPCAAGHTPHLPPLHAGGDVADARPQRVRTPPLNGSMRVTDSRARLMHDDVHLTYVGVIHRHGSRAWVCVRIRRDTRVRIGVHGVCEGVHRRARGGAHACATLFEGHFRHARRCVCACHIGIITFDYK